MSINYSDHSDFMQKKDFDYVLPPELIAQHPTPERDASRLLLLDPGAANLVQDKPFSSFTDFIQPNDCIVMNNTRVIPARLYGQKATGGKVEVLIERLTGNNTALAHVRASKSPKAGSRIEFDDHYAAEIVDRQDALFELAFFHDEQVTELNDVLEKYGHMPLPPYIEREDELADAERYQTVYAREKGAVAAPTAGLHFTDELIRLIQSKADLCYITLHVGAGTFQPVRVDDLSQHHMHKEWMTVSDEVVAQINRTKEKGGRVIAIGTTVVRALESAAQSGELTAYDGDTDIFIMPGYEFKVVDALLTNFHLPESTLLMLVSAFAGYDNVMQAYQHAISEKYRFFSYGDAMFITHRVQVIY